MTSYVNPYTGQTLNPSQVGYESLTLSTTYTYLSWPVNGTTTSVVANIIEANATVSPAYIVLPSAQSVSVGQAFIVKNTGATNSFTVVNNGLGTIQTIPVAPTSATVNCYYIYLTDNSTTNGTWSTVAMGVGTSSASAAALAGYGLQAITTTLNQAYNVSGIFSNYLIQNSDRASVLAWEGGAGTITLQSSSVLGASWFATVKNDGTGILTLTPSGTDTIDGLSSFQLQIGESLTLVSTGSGWVSYGYGQSATFFFTILSKVVTGGTVTLTNTEASNLIQEYSGTLTSNCTVILPSTVQLYSINNQTSGSYTLTFKTTAVGGATFTLPQGQTIILICDGTNVYNAQTAGTSGTTLSLAPGSAAAPSLRFTTDTGTGLYLAASGQLGIAIGGAEGLIVTSAGILAPVGITGGTF